MTDAMINASTPEAARLLEQAERNERSWTIQWDLCDRFAQVHTWSEADACLHDPWLRLRVAHARALRGEQIARQDLSSEQPGGLPVEESSFWAVPLELQPWEARHGNPRHLVRHHAQGGRSVGLLGFPPEGLECPIVLHAAPFQGAAGAVEELADGELSDWIDCVTTVHGTAEEAVAHRVATGGCGHRESAVHAAVIDFGLVYPTLLSVFGGDAAYGGGASESLGRLRLWRLLGVLAGSAAVQEVNGFVDRVRCLTW